MNFVSLGFGGQITLDFGGPIDNGVGDDVRIYETTFGNKTCSNYAEKAEIFASQNGCDFIYLKTICTNGGTVDLGVMSWAQFIRIKDVSDPASFSAAGADAFDVNGIECLNGAGVYADDQLVAGLIQDVLSYNPCLRKNNSQVPNARRITSNAIGNGGGAGINFVSLGFTGELTARFDFVVFNRESSPELNVSETSFGNPICNFYLESARFSVSKNGTDWTDIGTLCQDGTLEFGALDWAQYIKVKDESPIGSTRFGGTADGSDIDAITVLGTCGISARFSGEAAIKSNVPNEEAQMSVYPNPATVFITVDISG